jgi:hypothetical protein
VCPDVDYTLGDFSERKQGDDLGVAWFALQGPYTCRLRTRLGFVIQPWSNTEPNGRLDRAIAGVTGNPAELTVDAVLRPGAVVVRSWRWANSCGKRGRFTFFARAGTTAISAWSQDQLQAPGCSSRSAPSTLTTANVAVPICSRNEYRLRVISYGGVPGGMNAIDALASLRGSAPCRFGAAVTLALQHSSAEGWATVPRITGNPAHVTIGTVLFPSTELLEDWTWANWCGQSGSFRVLMTTTDTSATRAVGGTPTCQDASLASTLAASYNLGTPTPPR